MIRLEPSISFTTRVKSAFATGVGTIRKTVSDFSIDIKIVGLATKIVGFLHETGRIAPDACAIFLTKGKAFTSFGNFWRDVTGLIGEHSDNDDDDEDKEPKSLWGKISGISFTCMAAFDVTSFCEEMGAPTLGLVEKLGRFRIFGDVIAFLDKFPIFDILFFFGLMGVVDEVRKREKKNEKEQLFALVRDQMQIKADILEQKQGKPDSWTLTLKNVQIQRLKKDREEIKRLYDKLKPSKLDASIEAEITSLIGEKPGAEEPSNPTPNQAFWNQVAVVREEGRADDATPADTLKFYQYQAKRWTKLANDAEGDRRTGMLSITYNALLIGSLALKTFGSMSGIALFASGTPFMLGLGIFTGTIGLYKAVSKHYYSVNADHRAPTTVDKVNMTIQTNRFNGMCNAAVAA